LTKGEWGASSKAWCLAFQVAKVSFPSRREILLCGTDYWYRIASKEEQLIIERRRVKCRKPEFGVKS